MEHVLILNKIEVFDQNALLAGTDRCGVPNKNLHWLGTPSEWICRLSLVFVQTRFTSLPPLPTLETLKYFRSKLVPAPSLP